MLIGTTDNESGLFRVFVPPFPGSLEENNAFWRGENQRTFVCPAAERAARSAAEGNPTWRYRWHGVFPNTELASTPESGAYHDSEMAVMFGNVDQTLIRNTPDEEGTGRYIRGAWAAFARDPAHGLEGYDGRAKGRGKGKGKGWPRYVAEEETLVRLGWKGKAGVSLVQGDKYDTGC